MFKRWKIRNFGESNVRLVSVTAPGSIDIDRDNVSQRGMSTISKCHIILCRSVKQTHLVDLTCEVMCSRRRDAVMRCTECTSRVFRVIQPKEEADCIFNMES